MLPFACFLCLSLHAFLSQAAPAAVDPTSLSLNTITASNLSANPSLSGEDTLSSIATFLNTPNPGGVVFFRVPDTHTTLRIAVQDVVIKKPNLGRTILRTQQSLSAFINSHDAEDAPLIDRTALQAKEPKLTKQASHDDPYESDARYPGCFFGVATWPIGYHHLTYGIVMNVLQGLWLYLYRADRFQVAMFEVRDDQFGTVGIGKVTPDRPDGLVLGMGMGNVSVTRGGGG
ncbi:MAG: hypothetical protein ALECFALPRED_006118 [Alectoria fallacina]|uniref:Uncharacterized protein n=1 Tax=Alectoria fallacina TaxID=1903189 RepID=A0A8H3EPX0_9LECA|nr:MAG: hypothetical protein ALECFALPRED_006118 [Alectoria fallacina]